MPVTIDEIEEAGSIAYLSDSSGMLEIVSLSMLLNSRFEFSRVSLVQLTGNNTANPRKVIGTNILSLRRANSCLRSAKARQWSARSASFQGSERR